MDYIEVSVRITPYSEDYAEQVIAGIEELGFESFLSEDPVLKVTSRKRTSLHKI